MSILVVAPGPLATIQDEGRAGHLRDLGIGPSGAVDAPALALANRLVGNRASAAGIEVTMGGLVLDVETPAVVAITGAPSVATVTGGPPVGLGVPVTLPAGARLALGPPPVGVRTYLAVRGGVDVPLVLGSRSRDTLGGLGPPPLQPGDRLAIGPDPRTPLATEVAPLGVTDASTPVRLWPGPRAEWFVGGLGILTATAWRVCADSDRVGARLDGPPLRRAHDRELPSEGMVTGAVQVPHDGRPIVMLADHPVTGGYPVVAVVHPTDLPIVAQARPGTQLRFRLHRRG